MYVNNAQRHCPQAHYVFTYFYRSGDEEESSGGGVPQVGQHNPPIFGVACYVI